MVNFLAPGSGQSQYGPDPDPGELNQCESMRLRIWYTTLVWVTGTIRNILERNVGEFVHEKKGPEHCQNIPFPGRWISYAEVFL